MHELSLGAKCVGSHYWLPVRLKSSTKYRPLYVVEFDELPAFVQMPTNSWTVCPMYGDSELVGIEIRRYAVSPGGVSADLGPDGRQRLSALVTTIRDRFPLLVAVYDDTASLQDRTVGTGVLTPALARRFAAGGYVGRASGRAFDARRSLVYSPYDQLAFETPTREAGDVNARVWVRIDEVTQSLNLIEQILDRLPGGRIHSEIPAVSGEGMALVEGFRGDVLAWLRLAEGRVERCHLRDPSWFQWPLLEAVIEGNIVADFPVCNKSFNCSYSGHDL